MGMGASVHPYIGTNTGRNACLENASEPFQSSLKPAKRQRRSIDDPIVTEKRITDRHKPTNATSKRQELTSLKETGKRWFD